MAAHNMIDWVPCHANQRMLTDTLRHRFGLGDLGYIGSDNTNVCEFPAPMCMFWASRVGT